jgi:hypothetical protein
MRTILSTLAIIFALGTTAQATSAKPADLVFGPPTKECFDSTERVGHDLDRYKENVLAVQKHIEDSDTTILGTISFSAPQHIGAVREMLDEYGIKPRLIFSHSRNADGKTATMAVRVKPNAIEDALRAADPSPKKDFIFQGVVSLVGLVPNRQVASLQQDSRVYLVDITGDKQVTDGLACDGYVQHVTWQLYGLTQ